MSALNWKITGSAGEGIKSAGLILAKTAFKQGYFVHGYTEYPSLIRGGHNTFQNQISDNNTQSAQIKLDLLIALTPAGLTAHQKETTNKTLILTDQSEEDKYIFIPLLKLAKQAGGNPQHRNMVALGASCFFLDLKLETLQKVISTKFTKKGQDIVDLNLKAAQFGFEYAQKHLSAKKLESLPLPKSKPDQIFLTGNEAIVLGAIAGGMKFYTAYPMTPATAILHILAKHQKEYNYVVRHSEDEIGVVNMAIGASFAGVRSMTATSGGGFSLMTEALGLSGITEIPLTLVLATRPGPASGMPTWSSQGDLLFAINASQDEFPRIVFTPGDPQESFEAGRLAQNLAEKYQIPVIIMTDKYLGESYFSTDKFKTKFKNKRFGLTTPQPSEEPFKRYQDTDTGVSLRTLPGQPGGVHLANSYEHDELGYATEESDQRIKQVDKRAKKLPLILVDQDFPKPQLYGPQKAKTTLVSWGSNKQVILTALNQLKDTNFIHFPVCWPFPASEFKNLTKNSAKLVTLECNSTGQLAKLIRQETGIKVQKQILKYDGRPFFPSEILKELA